MKISPEKLSTRYDAVIVGGGHNGLVAANYLARAGKRILVVEQSGELGGATASTKIFPDYDAYISRYAYLISLLPHSILSELDIAFTTKRRSVASFSPYASEDGPSGLLLSNENAVVSHESFVKRTGSEEAWSRMLRWQELLAAYAGLVWPTLTEPLKSRRKFIDRLDTQTKRDAWNWFVEQPLGNAIEQFFDDDLVRGLVMTDAKIGVLTHPHDETQLQNRCFCYHVVGRGTGEWQVPVGGMGALVKGLISGASRYNTHLLTAATVIQIESSPSKQSVKISMDDQEFFVDCDWVLVNASPKKLAMMLNNPWKPNPGDEGSVVKVNMLLSRLPKILATSVESVDAFTGSLHINEGYQQMISSYRSAVNSVLPSPAPCEIYCHTLTDCSILSDGLKERGFHTLTLFGLDVPYRSFAIDHDVKKREILSRYLSSLNDICAEPFLECVARDADGSHCIECKTPQDLENEVGLDLGNIFHNELSWFFVETGDRENTWGVETEHDRILICGSAATRGGAVSGIPGRNAAMKVFEELKIGI